MSKLNIKLCIFLASALTSVFANLEGPFLFFGPKQLSNYRRPALKSLDQDDLVYTYENQAAIVVFNNQDAPPLTSDNFPRLRKLLERKTVLVLPQDFLDVHPEYVNNETQVITVQGPNSERDAEITETFERLEDIYGEGRVLGVLGSSSSQEVMEDDDDDVDVSDDKSLARERRDIEEEEEPTGELREAPMEVVYNGSGKILFYSSDYPILRYASGENGTDDKVYKLKTIAAMSSDDREQLSRLIVSFTMPLGKVTLRFRFPDIYTGYWSLGAVELQDPRGREVLLSPRNTEAFLGAPKGFSFRCSQPLTFSNGSVSLTFPEIQVQPQMGGATKFGGAYNCVGFTSVPIWSGVAVSLLLMFGVTLSIIMISDIKTMDRFENSKGKVLTFTVSE